MYFGTQSRIFRGKLLPQSSGFNVKRESAGTLETLVHVYQNVRHHITEDQYISKIFMHKNLDSVNIFVIKCLLIPT
jgi:hypothetical protein